MRYWLLFFFTMSLPAQNVYKRKAHLMGVSFEFSVVSHSKQQAQQWLDIAIAQTKKIEDSISSWKPTSQTSKINQNAGIKAVKVSKELFDLIKRSKHISKLTRGYFDISFASINKIWDFNKKYEQPPDSLAIKNSVSKINYQNIILNEEQQSVFLKEKGMKIGFGAIGKGFVAEYIKKIWKAQDVKAGLINASGDLTCLGTPPNSQGWKIAITNPFDKTKNLGWFDLNDSAVVTSGGYEKFIEINAKRYAHIINPKTGWPAQGLASVTIFCANAELADALATAVFVMGADMGMSLINQLEGVEGLLVDNEGKIYKSSKLNIQN